MNSVFRVQSLAMVRPAVPFVEAGWHGQIIGPASRLGARSFGGSSAALMSRQRASSHQRKLNRTMEHRRALLRNMVTSLIKHERIRTTVPKAKELRRVADRMVTLGKQGTLASRRRANSYIQEPEVTKKLFDDLAPRFVDRPGGYCRIKLAGFRRGDRAPMAVIEYVPENFPSHRERRALQYSESVKEE